MPKITLCAFSDESSPVFEEQIAALLRNNVPYMEMRNVDGKNVKKLTLDEAKEYKNDLFFSRLFYHDRTAILFPFSLDGFGFS